ncbi:MULTISPECIES: MOSC domain-containing protein [Polynucleobacter]|nr:MULTISPECIES: MOSC domain-containing protein [Polynucleobacter]
MIKPCAHIQAIYIAPKAGAAMASVRHVELIKEGIQGDRYAIGTGAYSKVIPAKIRHISLITQAGINTSNESLMASGEPTFTAAQTRRNIVIANMSANELNALVDRTFKLGNLNFKGVELCAPCQRPAQLLKKQNFLDAFEGRGGLRAEILQIGNISVGDELHFDSGETDD